MLATLVPAMVFPFSSKKIVEVKKGVTGVVTKD